MTDGEAPRTEPIAERFRQEVRELLEGEFTVEEVHVAADWTLPEEAEALALQSDLSGAASAAGAWLPDAV